MDRQAIEDAILNLARDTELLDRVRNDPALAAAELGIDEDWAGVILAGDRDVSTPLVWAKATATAMPGSRLVVVPGAGHSVQSRGGPVGGAEATAFLLTP